MVTEGSLFCLLLKAELAADAAAHAAFGGTRRTPAAADFPAPAIRVCSRCSRSARPSVDAGAEVRAGAGTGAEEGALPSLALGTSEVRRAVGGGFGLGPSSAMIPLT